MSVMMVHAPVAGTARHGRASKGLHGRASQQASGWRGALQTTPAALAASLLPPP